MSAQAGARSAVTSASSVSKMPVAENAAMLLTPPGSAAIAVVRIHGPKVGGFLEKYFSRPVRQGRCVYGILADRGREIDDAVVVLCDQTTADLNIHGGAWVVKSVMELTRQDGFALVDGGASPLSPLAVDASTILEEEVLSYLPIARTELGVRMLLAQKSAWDELILQ